MVTAGAKNKNGLDLSIQPIEFVARPFGGKAGPVRVLSTDVTTSV